MKLKILVAMVVCLLAGLVVAQSAKPQLPDKVESAKERYEKSIEKAEQDFIKAKSKAASLYYKQLDRAVKREKDPDIAKAISDERAKIKEEIEKLNTSKPTTPDGLVDKKYMNLHGSIFVLRKDGTFLHRKPKTTEFLDYGKWEPVKFCAVIKFHDGRENAIFEQDGKVYQLWSNKFYQLKSEK